MTLRRKVTALLAVIMLSVLAGCSSSAASVAQQNFGIQPGKDYSVLMGEVQSGNSVQGSVFLFFGSMSSTTQSALRIGYTNLSGDSYLLDIPVPRIVFHSQNPKAVPTATFSFDTRGGMSGGSNDYSQSDLQDLINGGLSQLIVTVTPAQWNQLVTG